MCTKSYPAWQLLVSPPLLIHGGGGQEEHVQTQTPGDMFGSRDDQDVCWKLKAIMEHFIDTGQLLRAPSWRLVENTFGQLK